MYLREKIKSVGADKGSMFHRIKNIREWISTYEKELFIALLIVLSSSLSFGLGRLTKLAEIQAPVSITRASSTVETIKVIDDISNSIDNRIVASQKGTKYYYPWCGGGKNIKAENRRYFTTASAAELAGYTRASNCQPKP